MATRYVTVSDLKDYLRNELPTEDDAFIEDAIYAAEMALDNACQRRFEVVSGAATARQFVPPVHGSVLRIDDAATITIVSDNGSTTTSYQAEPINHRSKAGETVPYTQIRLLSGAVWSSNHGEATATITGTWGWQAIPPQIVEACKIAAKAILEGRDLQYGLVALQDGSAIGEREARVVRQAIADYRRVEAFGIG